jgi:hypothetical protein
MADWVLIAGYVAIVSRMMFASFSVKGGKLHISNPEYSDFGPNAAIKQSFAVGHNFPPEYPHFSGDRIRYHFLFYFQAGNLEFLPEPAEHHHISCDAHPRNGARRGVV